MAFEQKEWLDRVSEFPMRRQLTDEDGNVELVTLERADGEVSTEGDAFSASNMNDLEQRVADAFGSIDLTATAISYNDSSTSLGASNVQGAIEKLKKFVSDGKSKIASAITNKGVSTSADATFATMAVNIGNIPNRNSGTYTPTWNGTHDMGYNNTYRYVNTNTIYNSGYSNGQNATNCVYVGVLCTSSTGETTLSAIHINPKYVSNSGGVLTFKTGANCRVHCAVVAVQGYSYTYMRYRLNGSVQWTMDGQAQQNTPGRMIQTFDANYSAGNTVQFTQWMEKSGYSNWAIATIYIR